MEYKTFVDICNTGTLEEVRGALANGADVNERDEEHFKMTGLMRAVVRQNEPLVSLLLQQPGIQVNAKDCVGWTALHYAAYQGHPHVVRIWTEAQSDGIGFVVANSIAC